MYLYIHPRLANNLFCLTGKTAGTLVRFGSSGESAWCRWYFQN